MKKFFIGVIVLVLLLVDYAALNDILKGESNPAAEYVTLLGSVVIIMVLLSYSLKKNAEPAKAKKRK